MKDYFNINKNTPLMIYGAGYQGRKLGDNLQNNGYHLIAYLDKQYRNFSPINQVEVHGFEWLNDGGIDKKSSVIIISLQDGFESESMAKKFYHEGFSNLIFLPMNIGISIQKKQRLREIYQNLVLLQYDDMINIPRYKEEKSKRDVVIIRETPSIIVFWCPEYILYSPTMDIWQKRGINILPKATQYMDIRVKQSKPYMELMEFLNGGDNKTELYLEIMGYREGQKEQLLQNRKQLYSLYTYSLRYEMTFFYYSPAEAEWNDEKKHFNIEDGMHRTCFLISQGFSSVPIIISRPDFEKYLSYMDDKSKLEDLI